jgi:hypothetical protein
MKSAVFGIARTYDQASLIVDMLRAEGFVENDISVMFPDDRTTREFAHDKSTKAPEGAIAGAGTGGVLGGTIGLLAGIGALAIPGLGPFIAAGPLMAALSGAAAGATVGGITGALIGMGIPEYEAKLYEGHLRDGNILLAVHVDDGKEKDRARDALKRAGAHDISSGSETSVPKEHVKVKKAS